MKRTPRTFPYAHPALIALILLLALAGYALAANNPNLTGISQGWVIGNTPSTVLNPVQGGSIRKKLLIQSDPVNSISSYICVAFGSPSQSLPAVATCTTVGGDSGGFKVSPGGSMEWPRDPGDAVPQGDVSIVCTTTNCNVTVFQQ